VEIFRRKDDGLGRGGRCGVDATTTSGVVEAAGSFAPPIWSYDVIAVALFFYS